MNKRSARMTGLVSAAAAVLPFSALASTYSIDQSIGGSLGLGTVDLKTAVMNIIVWVLGIMALIAVSFIIYGGFTWMTAAGNEDRIEKAKKIIGSAVVGLVVVLLAWAIVIFVAGTTKNVTS